MHYSSVKYTGYSTSVVSSIQIVVPCGKERRILIDPLRPARAAPVWNYVEVYWPCAGGLSAVNAIGKQLRDPINSGLTRWRMAA